MTTPDAAVSGVALWRARLEAGEVEAADALDDLATAARAASTRAERVGAWRLLGDIAGRAYDADWDTAERAAFVLLGRALEADTAAERVALLGAMGRAFRNVWLLPYVHRRLWDGERDVVHAAIAAAGGLGFPALEEALVAGFLDGGGEPSLRLMAVRALGRMGAVSAAAKLAPLTSAEPLLAEAALMALTEIRSGAAAENAVALLQGEPPRRVLIAATRYLAEIGRSEVLSTLRRLAREEDAELRLTASLAARALEAETARDTTERILAALTERDRAARAILARRLRTLPVGEVLEQAELLLSDDPRGVIQVVAELRAPEVTRFLIARAEDDALPDVVRAQAALAVEANEPWERQELARLATSELDFSIRAAAAQTLGAYASLAEILEQLAALADDASPLVRGSLLWALQLAVRPAELAPTHRKRAEALIERALSDDDASVRRRAAYVAGNMDAASLASALASLAQREPDRPDLRIAAFVALGEIASAERIGDLAHSFNQERDPDAIAAASRAIERTALLRPDAELPLERTTLRVKKLLKSSDARERAAAVRIAGLVGDAIDETELEPLARDPAHAVREQALTAIGRRGTPLAEPLLAAALAEPDLGLHERATEALLAIGTASALERVLDYLPRGADREACARLAERIRLPAEQPERLLAALQAALRQVDSEDPIYEPLLELEVTALEATRPAASNALPVDVTITALFPTWARLKEVRGFAPLARSLRTAESLVSASGRLADADLSAPIVLWMKCLEGYLHAWLGPRLSELQQRPAAIWSVVDLALGAGWADYQRFLAERWVDSVTFGGLTVDVPLRQVGNALREFQERQPKRLEQALSVTEWARMLLFLAVDHPAGARNLLGVRQRKPEEMARLAHRLHALAAVRNAVAHRTAANAPTVEAFRTQYYAAFEELTTLA